MYAMVITATAFTSQFVGSPGAPVSSPQGGSFVFPPSNNFGQPAVRL